MMKGIVANRKRTVSEFGEGEKKRNKYHPRLSEATPIFEYGKKKKGKGKVILLQARCGSEGG